MGKARRIREVQDRPISQSANRQLKAQHGLRVIKLLLVTKRGKY